MSQLSLFQSPSYEDLFGPRKKRDIEPFYAPPVISEPIEPEAWEPTEPVSEPAPEADPYVPLPVPAWPEGALTLPEVVPEDACRFPPALRLIRAKFSPRECSGYFTMKARQDPAWVPVLVAWCRLGAGLLPHQRVGVETAFRALEETGGFLLADGTGAGKSSQILVVCELFRILGKKVVIFAPSEAMGKPWAVSARRPVLSGSYANDAKRMGLAVRLVTFPEEIRRDQINITSYDKMSDKDFLSAVDEDTVVVFDEAHYLKNVAGKESGKGSGRGDVGVRIANKAYATLAATATPGDQVHHMAHLYRTGMLEGKAVGKALAELGIKYRPARDLQVGYAILSAGASLPRIYKGKGTEGGLAPEARVFPGIKDACTYAAGMGTTRLRVIEVVIEKVVRGPKWSKVSHGYQQTNSRIPVGLLGRTAPWKEGFDPEKDFRDRPDGGGYWGEKRVKPAHIAANVPPPELQRRVTALFNRMTAAGQMLKREIDMSGLVVDFDFQRAPEEPIEGLTWPEVERRIMAEFWSPGFPDEAPEDLSIDSFERLTKAQVQGHLRRAIETFKVGRVISATQAALREGRQVVVFADRVNKSDVNVMVEGRDGLEKKLVYSSDGTLRLLRAELSKRGIGYAELHGASEDDSAAEAMARFQSGRVKVILATAASGGTGINLDDITGDAPREMIVMTAPYGATENVQMLGRIHRLTTRSASHATYIFYDTEIDRRNAALMVKKLRFLGAIVKGGVADMALSPSLLRGMGLTDEEILEALQDEESDIVKVKGDSVGHTAPLTLEPVGPANGPWRIYGDTIRYRETIKKAADHRARWNPDRRWWEIPAAYVEKARKRLGPLLRDLAAENAGMPGARSLESFRLGVATGDLVPGRQPSQAEAMQLAATDPAEPGVRRLHEAYVRRAVLAGWPVPKAVSGLYPATTSEAERTRGHRERAAEVTALLPSGIGQR